MMARFLFHVILELAPQTDSDFGSEEAYVLQEMLVAPLAAPFLSEPLLTRQHVHRLAR